MKVKISPDTILALSDYIEGKTKSNPEIGTSRTVAVNQIVLEFLATANAAQTESLLKRLVTPGKRREQLLKQIASLSLDADSNAIQSLEKVIGKLQKHLEFSRKSAETPIVKTAISPARSGEI
ncbi:MAG: hypothetical protein JST04_18015 [Bdellovibrionales bacterium]|nr:hypothetical protein [Bdellovibrionales bacterium]